MQLTLEF